MTNDLNKIAAKTLGDSTSYAVYTEKFDPTLLNPMPRNMARDGWGIKGDEFVGFDVWHCHEATFLLNNGLPVAGTLKFIYPASSLNMVESKSMKLYLNSFDMCKMGDTYEDAVRAYETQVKKDLESVVCAEVEVKFFGSLEYFPTCLNHSENIVGLIGPEKLESVMFDDYKAERSHVEWNPGRSYDGYQRMYSNILRSRCRHTKQKDTGAAYIAVRSNEEVVDPLSVLRQIVSLREVNEFHEFCAEKLFMELTKSALTNPKVSVALLYSRRGSLDINPVRASNWQILFNENSRLLDINTLTEKTQGQ